MIAIIFVSHFYEEYSWHGVLMVSELDSEVCTPGSSPGQGHCVVLLGNTLNSHGASLQPRV